MLPTTSAPSELQTNRSNALSVQIADCLIETVLDTAFVCDTFYIKTAAHNHPYYELHVSVQGEYQIDFINGESLIMKPPMICLIPPDSLHHTEEITEHPQRLAVQFTYHRMRTETNHLPLYDAFHDALTRIQTPFTAKSIPIFQLVSSLRRETLSEQKGSDVLECLLLSELYIQLLRILQPTEAMPNQRKPQADTLNTRYIKIEAFMQKHLGEPITQKDLADALFLGTRQLSRILKSIYGLSFREMLMKMRLNKAVELITETELPLEKICDLVGYDSYSGFYLAFQKKYGMSASDFRKKSKNKP